MIKRITAMIIAVIIPIALLGGCKKKEPMTVQEYYDGLKAAIKQYYPTEIRFLTAFRDEEGNLIYSPENKQDAEKINSICDEFEAMFDDFEALVPPEQFEENHNRLIDSIKYERKWVELVRDLTKTKNAADVRKYNETYGDKYDKIRLGQDTYDYFLIVYFQLEKDVEDALDSPQ